MRKKNSQKTPDRIWDRRFYSMAKNEAETWSKDPQCKVGATLVSPDKRRFSHGYNGFPRGIDDDERLSGPRRIALSMHAEVNAILNAGQSLEGWTLYVTKHPCLECAKVILQAGIARVVCDGPTDNEGSKWYASQREAVALFKEAGVELKQLKRSGMIWA